MLCSFRRTARQNVNKPRWLAAFTPRIMRADCFYRPRSVLRSFGCHRIPHNTLPDAVFLGRESTRIMKHSLQLTKWLRVLCAARMAGPYVVCVAACCVFVGRRMVHCFALKTGGFARRVEHPQLLLPSSSTGRAIRNVTYKPYCSLNHCSLLYCDYRALHCNFLQNRMGNLRNIIIPFRRNGPLWAI